MIFFIVIKLENILFDENELPKICFFHIAIEMQSNIIDDEYDKNHIVGTPAYLAPEVYLTSKYSKSSDVYSFEYLISNVMCDISFVGANMTNIKELICIKGKRPMFESPIPKPYQVLIERCWSSNPEKRPTFAEIVNELKTNPDFITDEIDKDKYFEYVKYVDNFPVSFDENKRNKQLVDIYQSNKEKFTVNNNAYFRSIYQTEKNNIPINVEYKYCSYSLGEYQKKKENFMHLNYVKLINILYGFLRNQ